MFIAEWDNSGRVWTPETPKLMTYKFKDIRFFWFIHRKFWRIKATVPTFYLKYS